MSRPKNPWRRSILVDRRRDEQRIALAVLLVVKVLNATLRYPSQWERVREAVNQVMR